MIRTKLEKYFKTPPPEFRSACFWSWNDSLKKDELERQLQQMKAGGQAGGFMHSREGLVTEYLSKEWMDCVRASIKKAKELGIPVYLYDEDRWPSGFAGGEVTKKRRNAMKALEISVGGDGEIKKKQIITLPPVEYFNNTAYLDTLAEKPVAEFIESTYEAYRKAFGKEFGATVPAVFTDEPNMFFARGVDPANLYFPWTVGFGKAFKKRYGYDLLENAELLFRNTGDYKKARYHYRKLLAELFVNNYGKQLYDWCDKNGILLTGHYNAEDTLASQTDQLGAAMPLYEYMHIPGVDHLRLQTESVFLTIKQCSSAANQAGRERVLSELFGCSGQNMTFEDRRWLANWNIVLGVNMLCPHLWLYSMAGARKRDYPPTISCRQPWWKYNRALEDYFARLCFIMSRGKPRAKVLLLHPVESAWCVYNPGDKKPADRLDKQLKSVMKILAGGHYDFDLGDESLLSKYGRAAAKKGKAFLSAGEMEYELVIIPPVETLRASTVELVRDFISLGGKVIALGRMPERTDGGLKGRERMKELYRSIVMRGPAGGNGLSRHVEKSISRDISIKRADLKDEIEDIYCQCRRIGSADFYFMANNSRKKSHEAVVSIPGGADDAVEVWDAETGDVKAVRDVKYKNGGISFRLFLPPAGARLVSRRKAGKAIKGRGVHKEIFPSRLKSALQFGASGWELEEKGANAFTIDRCRLKAGGAGRWGRDEYVLDAQDRIVKKLKDGAPLRVKYAFRTDFSVMPEKIELAVERAAQHEIFVNGGRVEGAGEKWLDNSFSKFDISEFVKEKGENTVELCTAFKNPKIPGTRKYIEGGTEVESVYILGDFSVAGKFRKVKGGCFGRDFFLADSASPEARDAVGTGFPFYAGELEFSRKFDFKPVKGRRYYISLSGPTAVVAGIKINGKPAGNITCAPYLLEVTGLLGEGRNSLNVRITSSLRNLLGPHHYEKIYPLWTGPAEFNDKSKWTDDYGLVDFGLGEIRILEG